MSMTNITRKCNGEIQQEKTQKLTERQFVDELYLRWYKNALYRFASEQLMYKRCERNIN